MEIPLRCECGTVTGAVEVRGLAVHGLCYCRDCQAFARFLGKPERILDDKGGTEVIGTLPARLRFTSGQNRLACVTLTERGPYRWYAQCCRMAICNGGRGRKPPFVTLFSRTLTASPAELERNFGPASFVLFAKAATAPVSGSRLGFVSAVPKILWNLVSALSSGSWRNNPFFKPGTDEPICTPQMLSKTERAALRGDAPQR